MIGMDSAKLRTCCSTVVTPDQGTQALMAQLGG